MLKPTRAMLISAGIVGIVLIGGASVAANAFADRLGRASTTTERVTTKQVPTDRVPPAEPGDPVPSDFPFPTGFSEMPPGSNPDVVSRQVSVDPRETIDYWTPERIKGAEPMPMPEVTDGKVVEPSSN